MTWGTAGTSPRCAASGLATAGAGPGASYESSPSGLAGEGQLAQARTKPREGQAAEHIDDDDMDHVVAVVDDPPWLAGRPEFRVVRDVRHEPRDAEASGLGEEEEEEPFAHSLPELSRPVPQDSA